MDSGHSSSIQSSSGGGEEDYDTPVDSIASFLSPPRGASSSLYHHRQYQDLDPLSSCLNILSPPPPPPPPVVPKLVIDPDLSGERCLSAPPLLDTSSPPPPFLSSAAVQPPAAAIPAASPRGSKKRSRASRRVPITVLTTDTSNFRAMVQEFTGGSSSSFFPPLRADHFSSANIADAPPRCLFQPFLQKLPFFGSFSSSPSSAPPVALDKAGPPRTISAATAPSTSMMITKTASFPPGPDEQHKNLLNMANFQFPHHPTSGKYGPPTMASIPPERSPQGTRPLTFASSPAAGAYPPAAHAYASMGTLPAVSDITAALSAGGGDGTGYDDPLRLIEAFGGTVDGGDRGQFRSAVGNYGNSDKLRVSPQDFKAEKGSESVPSRRGGTFNPWIGSLN